MKSVAVMIVIIPIGLIVSLIRLCVYACIKCNENRKRQRNIERGDRKLLVTEQPVVQVVPPAYTPSDPYAPSVL